jgi:hypothetical protein
MLDMFVVLIADAVVVVVLSLIVAVAQNGFVVAFVLHDVASPDTGTDSEAVARACIAA